MRTSKTLLVITAAMIALVATASAQGAEPAARLDDGGVMVVGVDKHARYKAVYNIQSDAMDAGISKGLYYVRGLYEAFRKQGVSPRQLDVHLVLHGKAAMMLLKDEAYQTAVGDPFVVNPNANVVGELLNLGAHVEICHVTMRGHQWRATDVLPGVTIVYDGYTRLIALQNEGYAYIGGF